MMWPVSVAASTTAAGLKAAARTRASARMRRPSASVFKISTVLPSDIVMTSEGFSAVPEGMFSQAATRAVTFTGSLSSAAALTAASITAAPHMSNFISSMPRAGFREIPPASNVIPLPTSTTGAALPAPLYENSIKAGSTAEPLETPRTPPIFAFSIALRSRILTLRPVPRLRVSSFTVCAI